MRCWWLLTLLLGVGLLPQVKAAPRCDLLAREETFFQIGYAQATDDYVRALALLNCLIDQQPDDALALRLRGRLHYQLENYQAARNDFEALLAINPQDPVAHHGRGLVALVYGWDDLAWRDFHTAVELDPNYAEAYFHRGRAAEQLGSFAEAFLDYEAALRLGYTPRVAALWRMALLYERNGDLQGAQLALEEIIQIDPAYKPAYEQLGRLLQQQGRTLEAQFYFDRLTALDAAQLEPTAPQETAARAFLRFMPLMLVVLILSGLIGGGIVQALQRQRSVA